MSGDIELATFKVKSVEENGIEEYQEIVEAIEKPKMKQPKAYDFFTQDNIRKSRKKKKGKGKKSENNKNLMDLISCELAATNCPISENLIHVVEQRNKERDGYLQLSSSLSTIFQGSTWQPSFRNNRMKGSINPVFPPVVEESPAPDVHTFNVAPKKFVDLVAENDFMGKKITKFLNIEIKDLHFKHHHFFSLEQILAERLFEMYKAYLSLGKVVENIAKDIKVNRNTKDKLKEEFNKISANRDEVRIDPTIRKYTKQMLFLKENYYEAIKKRREVMNACVTLWCDIENVRVKSDTVKTAVTFDIQKKSKEEKSYETEWQEAFAIECADLLEKVEYDYVTKYLEYKAQKHSGKKDHESKIPKPKMFVDEQQIKEEAEIYVNETIKRDVIEIKVLRSGQPIYKEQDSDTICYFNIYVDNCFVCKSETCPSHDFEFKFQDYLSVEILSDNSVVDMVLFDGELKITSFSIQLQDVKKNNSQVGFEELNLVSDLEMQPNSRFIGSGHTMKEIASANKVRLKSTNMFKGKMYTNCVTNIRIVWEDEPEKGNDEAIIKFKEIDNQINRYLSGLEKPTIDGLKAIILSVYGKNIDDDERVIKILKKLAKSNMSSSELFEVNEESPHITRMKLLSLRNKGEMNEVEKKQVPIISSQISTEQLNVLQKSKSGKIDMDSLSSDKYTDMDPIEVQRFIGSKYIEGVNKRILQYLNDNLLRKSHRDVVNEDLSFRSIFTCNHNNTSNQNGGRYIHNGADKDLEINVTVYRAFNLPERNALMAVDENMERDDTIAGYKVRSLRPLVRVSHQGGSAQTGAAIGCHPAWSHTLNITTKSNPSTVHINIFDEQRTPVSELTEYSAGSVHYRCTNKWLGYVDVPLYGVVALGGLRGTFKVNTPPVLLGYGNAAKTKEEQSIIPQINKLLKKESSYIALQITTNKQPLTNHNLPLPNDSEDYIIKHLNEYLVEFKNDFPSRIFSLHFIDSAGKNKCVTQFLQPITLPDQEQFPKYTKRTDSAFSKSSIMSKSSSSKSMDGKRNEVEREERDSIYSGYERTLRVESDLDKTINAMLRYVSLIPAYYVREIHVATLMGVELLRILNGSPLDHTILLASYYLYLGLQTYIVMGTGLPRGPSSYVLTKYDINAKKMVQVNDAPTVKSSFLMKSESYVWYLFDAVSGEKFELRDVSCPLKTVDYIFDNENIWVNIQNSQNCETVSFDLTKTSQWQPVFDKNTFVMRQPVVTDANIYKQPTDTESLRGAIENRLRVKIQKWRPHNKVVWNRHCSAVLRDSLPQLESSVHSTHTATTAPPLGHKMRQLMLTHIVYGFPLNMPFTNWKSISSRVKATGVHVNDDPNVEFGLAVEVYGYPNNVLSVWVFVASFVRI